MRDIDQVIAAIRAQGWMATLTNGGHWRLASPTGELVFCPSTPSDVRAIRNIRARLRRAGAILAGKKPT